MYRKYPSIPRIEPGLQNDVMCSSTMTTIAWCDKLPEREPLCRAAVGYRVRTLFVILGDGADKTFHPPEDQSSKASLPLDPRRTNLDSGKDTKPAGAIGGAGELQLAQHQGQM